MKELPGLKFSDPNRRVYVFVQHSEFKLEPQCQTILNIIEQAGHISRYELCAKAAELIQTKNRISAIVSYHHRQLVRLGCIQVYPFPEWQRMFPPLEAEPPQIAKVVPNDRGGFSIEVENEKPVGNYYSPEQASEIIRKSLLIERD